MAVQEQTPYIEYTANGTTTSFALDFDCDNQDHLIVLVDDIEPTVGTWSLSGGAVVFNTAPENDKKITIQRNTPFSRNTDYQSYNNSFRPQSVNGDFDRVWLKLQELGVTDWLLRLYIDRLHGEQKTYIDQQDAQLQQNINNLKIYVDDKDDELRAYLMEEIRKQGVALDQLDNYYNYLMQRLAQIAVQGGWDASFVVDGTQNQKEINASLKNRFVFTSDYGASASNSDNTASLNAAATAAYNYNALLIFNDYYSCAGTVNFPDGLIVCGTSKTKTGFYSTNNVASITGANVQFSNMKIEGLGTLRVAVSTEDKDLPDFYNCTLNGRFNFINRTANTFKGCNFNQCDVLSDFGTDYNGVDQMDVFNIYGFNSCKFINNYIDVNNVHRLWKLTQGLSDPTLSSITNANTRDILIQGNTIKGKGGKQLVDCFFGTSCLKFINNHLELPDESTLSGAKWSCIIDNKTDEDARDIFDLGESIVIDGNTGYFPCDLINAHGGYGITQAGFSGNRKAKAKIVNNDLKRVSTYTAGGFVSIRFFNSVVTDNNTFEIPQVNEAAVMQLLSNESVSLGDKDTYIGGNVQIGTATNNSQLHSFSGKTGDVTLKSFTVKCFDNNAAVLFQNIDANLVSIDGVKSRPLPDGSQLCRAFQFTGTVACKTINVTNFDAEPKTAGALVIPLLDTVSQTALVKYQDNSWQPKFRGYVSAPPTTGTYLRGDTVKHIAPNAGTVEEWTCILGGSPGTWRATSWVVSKGATASRPTLTANDVGVTYLDTTLAASGKPIWWNGSNWVDTSGTIV